MLQLLQSDCYLAFQNACLAWQSVLDAVLIFSCFILQHMVLKIGNKCFFSFFAPDGIAGIARKSHKIVLYLLLKIFLIYMYSIIQQLMSDILPIAEIGLFFISGRLLLDIRCSALLPWEKRINISRFWSKIRKLRAHHASAIYQERMKIFWPCIKRESFQFLQHFNKVNKVYVKKDELLHLFESCNFYSCGDS